MQSSTLISIFTSLGIKIPSGTLAVSAPSTGETIAKIKEDTKAGLNQKIARASVTQKKFATRTRRERERLLEHFAAALKTHREAIAECLSLESGKTMKEALGEVDGSADILLKTIKDATLPELNGMLRTKERPAIGIVGLITSFNFPMAVAHWTIAPALLAGNAVIWKPSEKTPLVSLAVKAVFDKAAGKDKDLLQVAIGGRKVVGQPLVVHKDVGLISATGSVGMGNAIKATLAKKRGYVAPPILELGGNNGVIISEHCSPEHLAWSLSALMNSFLGSTGQRCTNSRRLFIHRSLYEPAVARLESLIKDFLAEAIKDGRMDTENAYGYNALIDEDAYRRFEEAKKQALKQGGKILLGNRILQKEYPKAYYVEPALALLSKQIKFMHEETFAPLLFVVSYKTFDEALALMNAPKNAGLVSAIYTQSQSEAEKFAYASEAGHALVNSPRGTGTPANGMGFGGNKDSGCGEILNSVDPLQAFTRTGKFTRIAWNKMIAMSS
jgi:aldehyde dehydrogenase (NAD+)